MLVNQGGFWDPLLDLIAHQVEAGYVYPGHAGLFTTVSGVEGVFDAVKRAPEPAFSGVYPRL